MLDSLDIPARIQLEGRTDMKRTRSKLWVVGIAQLFAFFGILVETADDFQRPPPRVTIYVGIEKTFRVDLSHIPTVPTGLVYSLNGEPKGAFIDQQTGIFRWIPKKVGRYKFQAVATNRLGARFTHTIVIDVIPDICGPLPDAIIEKDEGGVRVRDGNGNIIVAVYSAIDGELNPQKTAAAIYLLNDSASVFCLSNGNLIRTANPATKVVFNTERIEAFAFKGLNAGFPYVTIFRLQDAKLLLQVFRTRTNNPIKFNSGQIDAAGILWENSGVPHVSVLQLRSGTVLYADRGDEVEFDDTGTMVAIRQGAIYFYYCLEHFQLIAQNFNSPASFNNLQCP